MFASILQVILVGMGISVVFVINPDVVPQGSS